jgi:hypothetical protein
VWRQEARPRTPPRDGRPFGEITRRKISAGFGEFSIWLNFGPEWSTFQEKSLCRPPGDGGFAAKFAKNGNWRFQTPDRI